MLNIFFDLANVMFEEADFSFSELRFRLTRHKDFAEK